MGPVFRAYDPESDRLVAIKLFRLDIPPERVHRLVAEFERLIAAELSHPAITRPIATGIDRASAYLAVEFVAAESLDIALREYGPAPPADALRVAAQLAGALDFAAAVHVHHGVLHPRDVLLSADETRLTGLGIAQALERAGAAVPLRRPYTAPERMRGAEWDRCADVFSLAALVHEMLWGRRLTALGHEAAETLTEIAGGDLDALCVAFARALAERADERCGSALEFAEALKGAFGGLQSPVVSHQSEVAGHQSVVVDRQSSLSLEPDEPIVEQAPVEDLELRRAESDRYVVAELTPAIVEPLPADVPAALIARDEPEPISVLERSRSAVWPLVLALFVGVALGFAAGYGVGTHDRGDTTGAAVAATEATDVRLQADGRDNRSVRLQADGTDNRSVRLEAGETGKPDSRNGRVRLQPADTTKSLRADRARTAPGRLLVRSTPAGARVFVDGREYGRTPVAVRDLATGAHRVRVTRDGYAAEDRRVAITSARPARTMTLRLAPARTPPVTAALTVDSRPTGARVFIDGRLVGSTPVALSAVAAGLHAVRIERDGYRRWTSSVRVIASEQNRVTASLGR